MGIAERIKRVRERIDQACRRVERDPSGVQLVLVTKNVSVEAIWEAYEAGIRDFGENRVQEFLVKKPLLPKEIRWHFVGHLQTNKVRSLMGQIHWLHSLDRFALAEEIEGQAQKTDLAVDAFLQINTSHEETKSGFAPEEALEAAERLRLFERIRILGLMTIGPLTEDEDRIRECFGTLRNLRDEMEKTKVVGSSSLHLSMGMSSDFEWAVEEGATVVRIGTAIFGENQ